MARYSHVSTSEGPHRPCMSAEASSEVGAQSSWTVTMPIELKR
jgi:hypothetical protein